jgi:hypothetical protein
LMLFHQANCDKRTESSTGRTVFLGIWFIVWATCTLCWSRWELFWLMVLMNFFFRFCLVFMASVWELNLSHFALLTLTCLSPEYFCRWHCYWNCAPRCIECCDISYCFKELHRKKGNLRNGLRCMSRFEFDRLNDS